MKGKIKRGKGLIEGNEGGNVLIDGYERRNKAKKLSGCIFKSVDL